MVTIDRSHRAMPPSKRPTRCQFTLGAALLSDRFGMPSAPASDHPEVQAGQSHDSERRRHWIVCPYSEEERYDEFRGAQRRSAGSSGILGVIGGMGSWNRLESRHNASTQKPGRVHGVVSSETLNEKTPLLLPFGGSCSLASMERRKSWRNQQTSEGAMHFS